MIGWVAIVISELITAILWSRAKVLFPSFSWEQIGTQIFGLIGIITLCWTFILAIRHSIVEKIFDGLDRAYKAHHILGGVAFIALLNHVLFLIIGAIPTNTLALYLLPGSNIPYTLGIFSLYIMFFLLALTIYVKLPYRYWKWSHEWMGLVIIFGGLHGMLISSDTSRYMPLRYWILVWSVGATLAFLYKRFVYYFVKTSKYKVTRSGKQGELLVLSLESVADPVIFLPGQYGFFSLPNKKRDDHAFSILGSDGNKLIIGVKIVGDFTSKLSLLPVGSEVIVRGPFGNFGHKMNEIKHAVWIAGGIGITPFLSMAKAVKPEQRVEMYFCARILPPPVITEPFLNLSISNPRFVWLPCETSKGSRLSARKIFDDTGCDRNAHYMLCGPNAMMESIAEQLAEIGIKRSHIIYEDFAFK